MNEYGEKIKGVDYFERPGVYAIIIEEGKLALLQTSAGYFLPGGGIDEGETNEETLERELMEELGWTIEIGDFIGTAKQYFYSSAIDRNMIIVGTFYVAKKLEGPNEAQEPHHKLVWFTPNEAINNLFHEHQAWAVGKVTKKIRENF